MFNFLLNYKSTLVKSGIILSMLGFIAGYVFLLKVEIRNYQDTILTKDHNISELQETITLLEINDWVKSTNRIIKTSSNNAFENIRRLQELEREEDDKNVTIANDGILGGMFFKSSH